MSAHLKVKLAWLASKLSDRQPRAHGTPGSCICEAAAMGMCRRGTGCSATLGWPAAMQRPAALPSIGSTDTVKVPGCSRQLVSARSWVVAVTASLRAVYDS